MFHYAYPLCQKGISFLIDTPFSGMQVGHKTRAGCSSYIVCVWGLEVEFYLVLVAVAFNLFLCVFCLLSFHCACKFTICFCN